MAVLEGCLSSLELTARNFKKRVQCQKPESEVVLRNILGRFNGNGSSDHLVFLPKNLTNHSSNLKKLAIGETKVFVGRQFMKLRVLSLLALFLIVIVVACAGPQIYTIPVGYQPTKTFPSLQQKFGSRLGTGEKNPCFLRSKNS